MRLSSSVVTVGKHNTVSVLAINLNDHDLSFTNNKQVAVFQYLSPPEEEEFIDIGPEILALVKMEKAVVSREIIQLIRMRKTKAGKQPQRPFTEYDKIWFPTPEICQNLNNSCTLLRNFFSEHR